MISPRGRVEAAAPEFTRTVLTHAVAGMQGATPFVRWGNLAALGLCLIAVAMAFLLRRSGRP